MCNIKYEIISTGSDGNATVIDNNILIDCGVSYKKLMPYVKLLKLVICSHIHSDHFNRSTIRRLAAERPTLRFGAGEWLIPELVSLGVSKSYIDVYEPEATYNYGICAITPFKLQHNVPNMGYKLHFPTCKIVYATDTGTLAGVEAKDYDLYMVEANYEDDEIQARIKTKESNGEYAYEREAMINHLSKARCDEWVYANMGANSEYIYMHQHRGNTA